MFALFAAEPPPQLSGQTAAPSGHSTQHCHSAQSFLSHDRLRLRALDCIYGHALTPSIARKLLSAVSKPHSDSKPARTQRNTHHGRLYLQVFGADLGEEGDKDTHSGTCKSCHYRELEKMEVLMTNAGQRWQDDPVVQTEGMWNHEPHGEAMLHALPRRRT